MNILQTKQNMFIKSFLIRMATISLVTFYIYQNQIEF